MENLPGLPEINTEGNPSRVIKEIVDAFLFTENLEIGKKIRLSQALAECFSKTGETGKAADTVQFIKHLEDQATARKTGSAHNPFPRATSDGEVRNALTQAGDHLLRGRYKAAGNISQGILEKHPDQPDALQILGVVKTARNNYDAAIECFRKALLVLPAQPSLWIKLGIAYKNTRKFDQAEHAFVMALFYNLRRAKAFFLLGNIALGRGQDGVAEAYLRRAISLDPGFSQAYERLQKVKGFNVDADFLAALEKNTEHIKTSKISAIFAHYTLASHYARQRDKKRFIKHVEQANALQREAMPGGWQEIDARVQSLKKVFGTIDLSQKAKEKYKVITPIFIVGLYRSGSTLVEQILASHNLVAAGDEIHFLYDQVLAKAEEKTGRPYPLALEALEAGTLGELGQAYQKRLAAIAPGTPYITDKFLQNAFNVGLIHQAMPWARVVHINRNPMDRALSIYSNYFNQSIPYSYDLKNLARYTRATKTIMDYWKTLFPGFVLDVEYEDLVADIEGQTRRMLDFCGLEWDQACLEFYKSGRTVLSLSMDQVHKPIYKSSIGKWKEYTNLLEPFRKEMGDQINKDGFLVVSA